MTLPIVLLLLIVLAGLVLFALELVPSDVTALGILLLLIITRLLPGDKAFAGFASDAVIMILGILVMVEALTRTGVTDYVGRLILRQTDTSADKILLVVMLAAALMAAFISNTAATAFFLPIVIGLARRAKLSPAKFLMPLAFSSVLASSITLISTSTNVIVSSVITKYDMPPMGMFELTLVGVPILIIGLTYLLTLGRRLTPDRIPVDDGGEFSVHLYLTEIRIAADSPLVGQTLQEAALGRDLDLQVVAILRGEDPPDLTPQADTRLEAGDVLMVEGERENVLQVREMTGVELRTGDTESAANEPQTGDAELAAGELANPDVRPEDVGIIEVLITPGSPLIRRSLRGLRFRQRYGLQVLAVNRHGRSLRRQMAHIRFATGDVLVLQGDRGGIGDLERDGLFRILSTLEEQHPNDERAPIAIGIFVLALAAATVGLLSLPVAALVGALLVFVTRCITPEEAYGRINWRVLILIASMLGLGEAMEATGTAQYLAGVVTQLVGGSAPVVVLAGFFLLTVLLTQPMGDQAATVVILPVAIRTAWQLGLNPRAFAMIIALAASCSLLTPLEPACLLVYGPGHYRFLDYVKVGIIPAVLIGIIAVIMVPWLWPLTLVP